MTCKRVLVLSLLLIGTVDAFEPTELANCVIWLQAGNADIQTNPASGRVSTWLDRSGNNNHAFQTDTNRQPLFVASGLNGLPALHFDQRIFQDGYAAGLLTDKALTSAFSVFVVTRVVDDGERGIAWRRIVPSRDMNWLLGTYTPGTFYAHAHTGELSGPSARLRAPYQIGRTYTLSAVNTTSEQRFYVNGYDLTGDASRTTPPGRLTIGGAGSTSADPSDALIAEVIVYERALSGAEREQVETYLKTRYAVTDAGIDGSVWSGLGAGNLWSEAANWQQPLPTRPLLAFNTDRQTVSVNDLTGLTVDSIMVWDRDITVSGNPVTLENNFFCVPQSVVNWALDTDLPAGLHTFSVRNSRRLTLSGRLSGAGGICLGLGLDYAGTLDLACPTNSFTGPVRIKSGIAVVSRLAPGVRRVHWERRPAKTQPCTSATSVMAVRAACDTSAQSRRSPTVNSVSCASLPSSMTVLRMRASRSAGPCAPLTKRARAARRLSWAGPRAVSTSSRRPSATPLSAAIRLQSQSKAASGGSATPTPSRGASRLKAARSS